MDKIWQAFMTIACEAIEEGEDEFATQFLSLAGQASEMAHYPRTDLEAA